MPRDKKTTHICTRTVCGSALATVAFWLGGPACGIAVAALFVAIVCVYDKQYRRCWSSSARHSNNGKCSSAQSLRDTDNRPQDNDDSICDNVHAPLVSSKWLTTKITLHRNYCYQILPPALPMRARPPPLTVLQVVQPDRCA